MTMKKTFASLALAGLALSALCAPARPETVTLAPSDGSPIAAPSAPEQLGEADGARVPPRRRRGRPAGPLR